MYIGKLADKLVNYLSLKFFFILVKKKIFLMPADVVQRKNGINVHGWARHDKHACMHAAYTDRKLPIPALNVYK
jgi:hypothetical protein